MEIVSAIIGTLIVLGLVAATAFSQQFRQNVGHGIVGAWNWVLNNVVLGAAMTWGAFTWPFTQWRVFVLFAIFGFDALATIHGAYVSERGWIIAGFLVGGVTLIVLLHWLQLVVLLASKAVDLLQTIGGAFGAAGLAMLEKVGFAVEVEPGVFRPVNTEEIRARVSAAKYYVLIFYFYVHVVLLFAPRPATLGGVVLLVPTIMLIMMMAAAWAYSFEAGKQFAYRYMVSLLPLVTMAVALMLVSPRGWQELAGRNGGAGWVDREIGECISHFGVCVARPFADERPQVIAQALQNAGNASAEKCRWDFDWIEGEYRARHFTFDEYRSRVERNQRRCETSLGTLEASQPTTRSRIQSAVVPFGILGYLLIFLGTNLWIFTVSIKKKGEAAVAEGGGGSSFIPLVIGVLIVGLIAGVVYFATRNDSTKTAVATTVASRSAMAQAPTPLYQSGTGPVQGRATATAAQLAYVQSHEGECPGTAANPGRYGDPRLACRAEVVQRRLASAP